MNAEACLKNAPSLLFKESTRLAFWKALFVKKELQVISEPADVNCLALCIIASVGEIDICDISFSCNYLVGG